MTLTNNEAITLMGEITRVSNNIAAAYTALDGKGATLPETQNSANLADTIDTISTGGGGEVRGHWIVPPAYLELERVMENDTYLDGVTYKSAIGIIIDNYMPSFLIYGNKFSASALSACRTSDGVFYDGSETVNHTWDSTKDLEGGYRYIICYSRADEWGDGLADRIYIQNLSSATSTTSSRNDIRNYYRYLVFNHNIYSANSNVQSFLQGRLLESYKFINNHGFYYISTMGGIIPHLAGDIWYNANLKYIPSIAELGNPRINGTLSYYPEDSYYPNLPYGLDLSSSTGDWTIGNASMSTYATIEAYITLPKGNVTISSVGTAPNSYFVMLTKDNWQYIAEHAPTVSGKTLTMGAPNIAICGGMDGSIISTLTGKGWTVSAT